MRRAQQGSAPGVKVLHKVLRPHGAADDDAFRQVGDPCPVRDLGNDSVGHLLDPRIPRPVDASGTQCGIGGHRNQDKEVLVSFRRGIRVGGTGPADIERRRIRNGGLRSENLPEVRLPVLGEEQGVVLKLRQRALDAQMQQQSSGARHPVLPILLGVGLQGFRQQGGFRVVQVRGRDHQVRVQGRPGTVGAEVIDADGARFPSAGRFGGADPGDFGAGEHPGTLGPGQVADHGDDPVEAAHRVEHSVGEVQPAHQVVHAGGGEGR